VAAVHSITLSARTRIDSGTVRPSAFAVLRLMTNSNFVGCSTGRRGQTSSGVRQRPHPRNAPTILNAGLNFIIHWRGDRDNLEDQVIKALASPITNGQPDEKAIIGFTPLRNCRPNT